MRTVFQETMERQMIFRENTEKIFEFQKSRQNERKERLRFTYLTAERKNNHFVNYNFACEEEVGFPLNKRQTSPSTIV